MLPLITLRFADRRFFYTSQKISTEQIHNIFSTRKGMFKGTREGTGSAVTVAIVLSEKLGKLTINS